MLSTKLVGLLGVTDLNAMTKIMGFLILCVGVQCNDPLRKCGLSAHSDNHSSPDRGSKLAPKESSGLTNSR